MIMACNQYRRINARQCFFPFLLTKTKQKISTNENITNWFPKTKMKIMKNKTKLKQEKKTMIENDNQKNVKQTETKTKKPHRY